jgi:hypothetical protein
MLVLLLVTVTATASGELKCYEVVVQLNGIMPKKKFHKDQSVYSKSKSHWAGEDTWTQTPVILGLQPIP